jgi:hypothetical protein
MRGSSSAGACLGVFALASVVSCSSSSAPATAACTTTPDTSDDGGTDVNPDGVAYPTGCYGHTARSGSTPGSILQNLKFQGYLNGDSTQPLTTISLADYYDPCTKRYKLIHLSVAAIWCTACSGETDDFVAAKSSFDAQQIVVLQALTEGAVEGTPATVSDLNYWISTHKSNFTEMLDPGDQNFAGFFNEAALPWNADVDPRTMEILDSSEGYSGSVQGVVQGGLNAVMGSPMYPIPSSAMCP